MKQDVRQSLYEETNIWLQEVKKSGRFAGGTQPNLADLAVFGALNCMEGCDTFNELKENTKIERWYNDMKNAVETSHVRVRG